MLQKFLPGFQKKIPEVQNVNREPYPEKVEPFLSQYVTFGDHLYRRPGEIAEVIFYHRAKKIRRTIVDNTGNICSFPGFAEPERLCKCLEKQILPKPVIRFRTDFSQEAPGIFLMIWEVQPDGRYWEDDDGFGGTSDEEVRLYSHIDDMGNFTHPFQIYNIGCKEFYTRSVR